jgi:hypothetical protein
LFGRRSCRLWSGWLRFGFGFRVDLHGSFYCSGVETVLLGLGKRVANELFDAGGAAVTDYHDAQADELGLVVGVVALIRPGAVGLNDMSVRKPSAIRSCQSAGGTVHGELDAVDLYRVAVLRR